MLTTNKAGQCLLKSIFLGLPEGNWLKANFNDIAKSIIGDSPQNPFLDPHECGRYVNMLHKQFGIDYSYGGYLENRSDIWSGHYMGKDRAIHLGVDYNVPAGTVVTTPVVAKVVRTFYDPDQNGGWGGLIVFQAKSGLYFALAHLKTLTVKEGQVYDHGDAIGVVAEPECNGGWYPHLHVQCMRALIPNMDGYCERYDGMEKDYLDPECLATWE